MQTRVDGEQIRNNSLGVDKKNVSFDVIDFLPKETGTYRKENQALRSVFQEVVRMKKVTAL